MKASAESETSGKELKDNTAVVYNSYVAAPVPSACPS